MKKIIPFILILIILTGLFSPVGETRAQTLERRNCVYASGSISDVVPNRSREECRELSTTRDGGFWYWTTATVSPWGGGETIRSPGTGVIDPSRTGGTGTPSASSGDSYHGCNLLGFGRGFIGCVAALFYLFFDIATSIARLAGHFLDFFIYYSTNSSSYNNEFVERGWAVVRDVANIFFIIALLYIAIKTVLSLEGSNSKKMIANIIIIALIINFSLFATKVVIDGSNILAKIFYNSITPKDVDKNDAPAGAEGQKSISIGLVDKFNPQNLISKDVYTLNQGMYIFLTIFLTVILLYMAYVFFAVALLFVARVISLWLSMIFAPLAFISYAVPFDIPGFGHKTWWDNLLKNAFLAPLFVFFLYIIVLFTGFLENIISYDSNQNLSTVENLMQHTMGVLIPFTILMVLLMKAKKLAVEYSGDMGKAVMSAGKVAGGLALGATAGGLAIAGRAGLGSMGSSVANSAWAKRWESEGRFGAGALRSTAKAFGSGSFDVRGAKIAGKTLGGATGMNVGEAQKGGFEKRRKDQVEKRQKRAQELEVSEDEPLKQALNTAEADLQTRLHENAEELHDFDEAIKRAKDDFDNAGPAEKQVMADRLNTIRDLKADLKRRTGITDLETTTIPHAKLAIETENRNRKRSYAAGIASPGGIVASPVRQIFNIVRSGGQHSLEGDAEAAHKIIMETKMDSGEKH